MQTFIGFCKPEYLKPFISGIRFWPLGIACQNLGIGTEFLSDECRGRCVKAYLRINHKRWFVVNPNGHDGPWGMIIKAYGNADTPILHSWDSEYSYIEIMMRHRPRFDIIERVFAAGWVRLVLSPAPPQWYVMAKSLLRAIHSVLTA